MSRKTTFKEYYWFALLLLILGSLVLMVIAACCGNKDNALLFAGVLIAVCIATLISYKFYPPCR